MAGPRPISATSTFLLLGVILLAGAPPPIGAQGGTPEDYRRALELEERYSGLVSNVVEGVRWLDDPVRLTFRRSVEGGREFLVAHAETGEERPAFDHQRLAEGLSALIGEGYTSITLPFYNFRLVADETTVEVQVDGMTVRCTLADYRCSEHEEPSDGPSDSGNQGSGQAVASPDGQLEASVEDHNVVIRDTDSDSVLYRTHDGSEGDAYRSRTLAWSPDSRRLVAYRVAPGHERLVHYVESAPEDQLQPRHSTRVYTKPGDVLDMRRPVLFQIEEQGHQVIADDLFPNAYSISDPRWREDGREFTFEYNQRGHQVYRIVAVDARTGEPRLVVSEEPETFFYYRSSSNQGKYFRHDMDDGREVIWMSERAGWQAPEVFTSLGRDGVSEIWGTIIRPSNFDPELSYPVIEYIYAGPHSSHVPKAFTVLPRRTVRQQAELGFIVAQIDGMGTSNRSKAFHDVAWKNLGDAGFPDRILWHEAVAKEYPYYDLERVGIYGHSAGGQNALGALLFHPDFYHVAVSANGCHDNRMDKICWNELWMGQMGPHIRRHQTWTTPTGWRGVFCWS